MEKSLVFSIEEFSVFDGPGVRTTVFLKGCPLRCEWCHNPEGQSFQNAILRTENGCIGCGECLKRAETRDGETFFTENSINNCPQNLLRYIAKSYTSEELCDHLSKNFGILNSSGGGITFSGGEPLANHKFLLECLSLTRGKIHRAVQTSGYADGDIFCRVMEECDYMLFDIKLVNEEAHLKYTGASNGKILQNFRQLSRSCKDFVVRTPLIPTVTDSEENIQAIAKLLSENGVKYIELLPYNKLAGAKYRLVGKEYQPSFDGDVDIQPRLEIFAKYGIEAVMM